MLKNMFWLPSIWKQYIIHLSILIGIMVIYFEAQHTSDISSELWFFQKSYTHYSKVKYNIHTSPIFNKYNILKLPDIHNIQLGKLMHSITMTTLPQPMFTIFTTNDDAHSYDTRQKKVSFIMVPNYGSNCLNMSKGQIQYPLTITVWGSIS